MNQSEKERETFLSLCGKRDRAILTGTEKMTFADFERLMYLSGTLGLDSYNIELCNQYAGAFEEQFRQLQMLGEEDMEAFREFPVELAEIEEELRGRWIEEFYAQIPEKRLKAQFKRLIKKGLEN